MKKPYLLVFFLFLIVLLSAEFPRPACQQFNTTASLSFFSSENDADSYLLQGIGMKDLNLNEEKSTEDLSSSLSLKNGPKTRNIFYFSCLIKHCQESNNYFSSNTKGVLPAYLSNRQLMI